MGWRFGDEHTSRRKTRPWFWHEHKLARRESNRHVRHIARTRVDAGEYDLLPKPPRSEGWLTW